MTERYHPLYTADQVNEQIARIASEIVRDHRDDDPLFVALLRGAAPFASKLMFEVARQAPDMHPDLDYMMISTYGNGRNAGEPRIITDLAPTTRVKERTVIILDDVLDKGVTAEFVRHHLKNMGAAGVKLATLAQKRVERVHDIEPDYCGFDANEEWLVGMGMDDAKAAHEGYRWLDQIWEITQD
jgi:hypoxanthine phosphoribosyltransferase